MIRQGTISLMVPLALVSLSVASNVDARTLGIAERIRAQESIERVYYGHQIGAARPFEQAVPHEALEKKVHDYLKRSAALERFWHTPVTSEALQAELERMARSTRYPERLLQVYRALGNDPLLIRECFARPVLVDRLSRNFFDFDRGIHAAARAEAAELEETLRSGRLRLATSHPRRTLFEIRKDDPRKATVMPADRRSGNAGADGFQGIDLPPDDFDRWRARFPENPGDIGPLLEERDAFILRALLDGTAGRARVVQYRVPKLGWDAWWQDASRDMEEASAADPAMGAASAPLPHSASVQGTTAPCDADDTWDNGSLDDLPS